VLLGAILLGLALVVAIGGSPKKADAATQAVTMTFNKPGSILIPAGANVADCASGETLGAAAAYPSDRNVQAFPAHSTILDVNLVLRNFTHFFPDDVDVLLSKGARNRTVMSDIGASDDVQGITLRLDDEASSPLPDQRTLHGGTFRPKNAEGLDVFPGVAPADVSAKPSLSGFDGVNPNGIWHLRVVDDANGDCGAFADGWTLIIKASNPAT
jgi:hypothetical protein